ncbi:MAG TPA: ribonuclease HII [Alphaproteobacteria bacterium]|nr:ribonuclease HII [Alphaproteobacteria bacterium]
MPDTSLEIGAGAPRVRIAGIDEVGRGPLAGPVVAAAVVLPAEGLPPEVAGAIDDSKALRPDRREALLPAILAHCHVGIGRAEVEEIDRVNILQATYLAMCRALDALPRRPDLALVDGNRIPPGLSCPGQCVVRGDALSLSIAAASVVAKVTRDREMAMLALRHPGYGWERNAGYGTAEHREALARLGVTPQHRRSFAPVAEQLTLSR